MVTCDGAGASHGLIARLDKLASRRGYQVTYSVGWELGARERSAIALVPEAARQITVDGCGEVRERRADETCASRQCAHRACWVAEAHVTELTGLLREGSAGSSWTAGPPRCGCSLGGSGRIRVPSCRRPRPPAAGGTRCGSLTCPPLPGLAGEPRLHRRRSQSARPGRGRHPDREELWHRPVPLP
jgi:hypothetical protein